MSWKLFLIFLYFQLSDRGSFCSTIESLGNAGQVLAHLPLNEDTIIAKSTVSEVPPTFYDLAISRLQSKTDEVITGVWEALDNKRQLVILSEKGLATGVLEKFALLKNDILDLENQVKITK